MTSKNNLFQYWESLIITLGILYLSFAPPSTFNGVPTFEYEDKLVHLLMYAGLTSILIFDFRKKSKYDYVNKLKFVFVCLIFPVFLGGAVEILQPMYFAPRSAEWTDWLSDIIGVVLGLGMMRMVKLPRSFYSGKSELK
jgi:VanZ family protein